MEPGKVESVMEKQGLMGEVNGFMPHNNGYPLLSRDWDSIDCASSTCANNAMGTCVTPSLAKIGEDGRCKGFTPKGTLKVEKGDEV